MPAHPIYPRPVPPLHFEPLYTKPEDVLWEPDSTDEKSDSDEGARAAKRRRIEKLGEAYLRGEELFILSAGIRGPLGSGWVNPWKKKRKVRLGNIGAMGNEEGRGRTVPETVERGGKGIEDGRAKKMLESQTRKARRVVIEEEQEGCEAGIQLKHTRKAPAQHDPFHTRNPTLNGEKTPNVSDGKAWLKKNYIGLPSDDDFYTEDVRLQQGSPSPRVRASRPAGRNPSPPAEQARLSKHESDDAGSFDGRAETLIKRLRRCESTSHTSASLARQNLVSVEKTKPPEILPSRSEHTSAQLHCSHGNVLSKDAAMEDACLGEHPPVSRGSEQKLPSPPGESSPVEAKKMQDHNLHQRETLESLVLEAAAQNDPRASPPADSPSDQQVPNPKHDAELQGPPEPHRTSGTMPPPTLSAEASNATVVSILPSAQILPAVQALPPNESLPSTGDKLSEQYHHHRHQDEESSSHLSTQAAIAAANLQQQHELTTPHAPTTLPTPAALTTSSSTIKAKSKNGITLFSAFNEPTRTSAPHPTMNTQEMLDATTPFNLTTTVKKTPLPTIPPDPASPTRAQNPIKKNPKLQKRASFAPPDSTASSNRHTSGSSQGSIKDNLKVSKSGLEKTMLTQKRGESRESEPRDSISIITSSVPEFGPWGLDMETSPDASAEPGVAGDAGQGPTGPGSGSGSGSAAKLTTNPTPASASQPRTSAELQDAQRFACPPHSIRSYHSFPRERGFGDHTETGSDANAGAGFGLGSERAGAGGADENAGFDLSAAMDEVGSFLQSWDMEREVRGLGRKEEKQGRAMGWGRGL